LTARAGKEFLEEDSDGEDELDDEHGESGRRMTTKVTDPRLPSISEVEEHCKTHLPYRNWCRHCVLGRGKEIPHKKSRTTSGIPEVSFDFCFLGKESEPGQTLPILCVRERSTRMTMASAVPSKSTGTFIAQRSGAYLKEIGCLLGEMIHKSYQEPAILTLVKEVGKILP
jgi:hypothetical protein